MLDSTLIIIATLFSALLVLYHHLGYPLIMRAVLRRHTKPNIAISARRYDARVDDQQLPTIAIVIAAYNEQQWIAEKIRNLSILDYPAERLNIIIACDGCMDATPQIARQTIREPECQNLNIEVLELTPNRGKVAVLNQVIQQIDSELIALSDVSALISVDALLIAAKHFNNPQIGVLNSHYQLLSPGSVGEATYWNYQSKLKAGEAAMGATLGAHGAFYLFRRRLFQPLQADTINDDFILPMQIVAQGYHAEYEPLIAALELEQADANMDQQRRRRIAAGNVQQLLRLKRLLLPQYGGVAFTFASGKGLRVLMPFLMLICLFGSLLLAMEYLLFAIMAGGQLLAYSLAAWQLCFPDNHRHRYLRTLSYLVSGHIAGLIGTLRYLFGLDKGRWKRVTPDTQ